MARKASDSSGAIVADVGGRFTPVAGTGTLAASTASFHMAKGLPWTTFCRSA